MESYSKVNAVLTESEKKVVWSKKSEESKSEDIENKIDDNKPASTTDRAVAAILSVCIAAEKAPLQVFEMDRTRENPAGDQADLIPREAEDLTAVISGPFEASMRPGNTKENFQLPETSSASDVEKPTIKLSALPMYDHSPTDTPANAAWKDAMRSAKNYIQPGRLHGKQQVQNTRISNFRPSKCVIAEICIADSATSPEPVTVSCVAEIDIPPNMILVCSDLVRFRCHRAFIAEASPIFANIVAANPEMIQLITMGSAAVRVLLHYIYTGTLDEMTINASRVLPAAQIYGMVRLKLMVERMLCTQIRRNNAVKLAIVAHLFSAELLKQRAMEFICVHFDIISRDREFQNAVLTHVRLFQSLYEMYISFDD